MPGAAAVLRHELIGLAGVFERNVYLVRRYIWWDVAFFLWTVANTLTIVFIAKGIEATGGQIDVDKVTTTLLVGAVVWAYLGIIFEILTETVAWERWEGTIEYTFMAPLSRPIHLFGMGAFAIVYGIIRAVLLFGVVALFFDLDLSHANFAAALIVLLVASISFIGIGMMTAVLPLISPRRARSSASSRRGSCSSSRASTTRSRCSRSGCSGSRSSRRPPTRSTGCATRSSTATASPRWATRSGRWS